MTAVMMSEKIGSALAEMSDAVRTGNQEGQQCVAFVAFAIFVDGMEPGMFSMARSIAIENAPAEAVTIALNATVDKLEAALGDPANEVEPGVDA